MGKFKKGDGRKRGPVKGVSEPVIIREAKQFNKITYDMIQHKISHMTMAELKDFIRAPTSTVLEVTIAAVWAKSMQKGDVFAVEQFTNRMIGPVTKKVSVDGLSFTDLMAQQAALAKAAMDASNDDDGDE